MSHFGLIGRSHLGLISFGVVGPKRPLEFAPTDFSGRKARSRTSIESEGIPVTTTSGEATLCEGDSPCRASGLLEPGAAANGGGSSRLQSTPLVAAVAELESLGGLSVVSWQGKDMGQATIDYVCISRTGHEDQQSLDFQAATFSGLPSESSTHRIFQSAIAQEDPASAKVLGDLFRYLYFGHYAGEGVETDRDFPFQGTLPEAQSGMLPIILPEKRTLSALHFIF